MMTENERTGSHNPLSQNAHLSWWRHSPLPTSTWPTQVRRTLSRINQHWPWDSKPGPWDFPSSGGGTHSWLTRSKLTFHLLSNDLLTLLQNPCKKFDFWNLPPAGAALLLLHCSLLSTTLSVQEVNKMNVEWGSCFSFNIPASQILNEFQLNLLSGGSAT
jgi:hypothetical protein